MKPCLPLPSRPKAPPVVRRRARNQKVNLDSNSAAMARCGARAPPHRGSPLSSGASSSVRSSVDGIPNCLPGWQGYRRKHRSAVSFSPNLKLLGECREPARLPMCEKMVQVGLATYPNQEVALRVCGRRRAWSLKQLLVEPLACVCVRLGLQIAGPLRKGEVWRACRWRGNRNAGAEIKNAVHRPVAEYLIRRPGQVQRASLAGGQIEDASLN